ncbi:MAG: MGMT family protein [Candidatus Marinimicrobia bacterium]|nr:MGMT family protein [Candidatus Neomarinimicrobiota bacterium]
MQAVSAKSIKNKSVNGWKTVYETVGTIPRGQVATYGQVARAAGLPGHARMVGYALHVLPEDTEVPWHRVINAKGEISLDRQLGPGRLQQLLLEAEGVFFNENRKVNLRQYRCLL